MICKHCKQPVHEANDDEREGFDPPLNSPAYKHDDDMWTCVLNDCMTFAEIDVDLPMNYNPYRGSGGDEWKHEAAEQQRLK